MFPSAAPAIHELTRNRINRSVPFRVLALIYAGLEETDNALMWLARAVEQHDLFLTWMNVEPMFDSVRSEPRFTEMVKRIGLKPTGNTKTAL